MKKYILILTILILFTGAASAGHTYEFTENYNFPDVEVTQDEFVNLKVACNLDSGGECPADPRSQPEDPPLVEICGNNVQATTPATTEMEKNGDTFRVFLFKGTVDRTFGCTLTGGSSQVFDPFKLYDQEGVEVASGGQMTVKPVLEGKYLNVDLNSKRSSDGPLPIGQFHLTDDPKNDKGATQDKPGYGIPDENGDGLKDAGYIMVQEEDNGLFSGQTDEWASFDATEGFSAGITDEPDDGWKLRDLFYLEQNSLSDLCYTAELTGACNDRTYSVINQQFTSNTVDDCGSFLSSGSNCYLAQVSGNDGRTSDDKPYYIPRGDILLAYPLPENEASESDQYTVSQYFSQAQRFYVCEEGSEMEGEVRYANGEDFICSSGVWRNATECNDGIDNDNDFTIDHRNSFAAQDPAIVHDPGCESPQDDSENDNTLQCGVNITEQYISGGSLSDPLNGEEKKVVTKWKNEEGVDSCVIDYVDTDLDYNSHTPQVFTCRQDPTQSQIDSEAYPYATDLAGVADLNAANDYCANLPDSAFSGHIDTVKTAQFFAAREAIPLSSQDEEAAKRYIRQDSSGNYEFKNMFFQTLHSAETGYAPACSEVFSAGGTCGPGFDHEHDAQTWDYLSMQDTGDGYSQDEYIDSWTIGNVSANNSDVYSHDSTTASSQAFPGGFAGKCDSPLKWVNNGNGWKCGLPSQTITMNVSFISSTQTKVVGSNLTGGITIADSEVQKWKQLHSYTAGAGTNSVPPSGNEYFGPLNLDALCFEGTKAENNGQVPASEYVVGLTDAYTGSSGLGVVTENIPNNPNIDSNHYTCIYGFSQEINDTSAVSGLGGDRFVSEADSGREFIFEGVPPGPQKSTNLDTVHGLVDWSGSTSGSAVSNPFKGYKTPSEGTQDAGNYRDPEEYYLRN